MQNESKSVQGRKSAGSARRRTKARPLTTSGSDLLRDGCRSDVITQGVLAEYPGLKSQQRQLKEVLEARRSSIIERHDDGATIEPGFFNAEVRRNQQRLLTAEKLEEVLGPDEVERLKCLVTPTICIQLWVT
jgi:hypothetical protein